MKPGEKQLWRVLNASAITYLDLEVLAHRAPQPLGLVAMDGVPIGYGLSATAPEAWLTSTNRQQGEPVALLPAPLAATTCIDLNSEINALH